MKKLLIIGILLNAIILPAGASVGVKLEPAACGSWIDDGLDGTFDRSFPGEVRIILNPDYYYGSYEIRGVIEYDLSSIPANAVIEKATLNLFWFSGSNETPKTSLYGYIGDGVFDKNDISRTGNLVASGLPGLSNVNVTSFIQELVNSSANYAGFLGVETERNAGRNYGYSLYLDVNYLSPPAVKAVNVDIKPGGCPNPFNVRSKGVLPVAILGTENFDVNSIDPMSIKLAGVAPIRYAFEDVASPVLDVNDCNCAEDGPDGFVDLTLKFDTQQIARAIGEVKQDDVFTLTLTGTATDQGTKISIEGFDCIVIVGDKF